MKPSRRRTWPRKRTRMAKPSADLQQSTLGRGFVLPQSMSLTTLHVLGFGWWAVGDGNFVRLVASKVRGWMPRTKKMHQPVQPYADVCIPPSCRAAAYQLERQPFFADDRAPLGSAAQIEAPAFCCKARVCLPRLILRCNKKKHKKQKYHPWKFLVAAGSPAAALTISWCRSSRRPHPVGRNATTLQCQLKRFKFFASRLQHITVQHRS